MAPKKKQEKMALGDFLQNQSLGSWADEMENTPVPSATASGYGGERRAFSSAGGWGDRSGSGYGDKAAGGGFGDRSGSSFERQGYAVREQLPLPSKPPYTAHLGNLAFDVTSTDIENFLGDCQVTNVRIVEDKMDHRPKGFGYVEFATVDGLKKALTLSETQFQGRNIRISVAEPPKDGRGEGREITDWSRKGPLPDLPGQGVRRTSERGGFGRNYETASDAGSERGGDKRRPGFFEGDGKVRDFSNWERKGPLSPAPGAAMPMRDGGRMREGGAPSERRQSPAWGEGRSEAGSRPPRREFQERPPVDRAPTAADQDSQWRTNMRPDAPSPAATPDVSTPSSPAAAAPPSSRPRLNLAKRTVSTAEPGASTAASDSKASPFGAARPIDTQAREKEIEEKRQLSLQQKKEQDEKAAEEKKAKDEAARASKAAERAARADRADKGQAAEKIASPTSETSKQLPKQNGTKAVPKENGEAPAQQRPSFSILKHEEDGEEEEGEEDAVDGPANGNIVGDKETKPQEVVREAPKDGGSAWQQNTESTADSMEGDGWSTVAAKPKSSRRGGARALAS